jgi:DNA-binding beta-propeller fold protein YncE
MGMELSWGLRAVSRAAAGVFLIGNSAWALAGGYHLLKQVPLPRVTGWDYLAVDSASRRLFVSNNSGIVLVNVDSFEVVGTVPNPPSFRGVGLVHGVAIASALNRGFISLEIPPSIVSFDLQTLAVQGTTATDRGTDAIVYEPLSRRVFSFNSKHEGVHDVTAVNAVTGEALGNIPLPAAPEFAVADGVGHLYVNIAGASRLGRIDARTLNLTNTWSMAPCEEASGLALDTEHHRLFASCENRIVAMIDAANGHVLATVPSGEGTDAVAFDPGTGDVFASNGEGTLIRAHANSPTQLNLIENIRTEPQARTMALDASTHRVFLLTARFGTPPMAATPDNPHRYPLALPGTARLLVYGP